MVQRNDKRKNIYDLSVDEVLEALALCTENSSACEDCPFCGKCLNDPVYLNRAAIVVIKKLENQLKFARAVAEFGSDELSCLVVAYDDACDVIKHYEERISWLEDEVEELRDEVDGFEAEIEKHKSVIRVKNGVIEMLRSDEAVYDDESIEELDF